VLHHLSAMNVELCNLKEGGDVLHSQCSSLTQTGGLTTTDWSICYQKLQELDHLSPGWGSSPTTINTAASY
jgi:hypothetical protein